MERDRVADFADINVYRTHELENPRGADPVAALLPLVDGDPDRWLAVGEQIKVRTPGMGAAAAVESVKADLEAKRL